MTKCLKEADFVFKECVKQTSGVNAGDASSSQSYPTSNSSSMAAQDCRVTETTSVVENKFENGCIVTMDTFKNKTDLENLWKNIKIDGKYNCAYIKIDGGFSGCINDYLNS
jgi:hypothetical protein